MLFTFPSWYLFTIDLRKYLALPDSPGGFVQDFSSPALLETIARGNNFFHRQGYHLLWQSIPALLIKNYPARASQSELARDYLTTPTKHVARRLELPIIIPPKRNNYK